MIERLREEKRELDGRLTKLTLFLNGEEVVKLRPKARGLLYDQHRHMTAYTTTLRDRIVDLLENEDG